MGETFYDVLEVGADATQSEIEAAYRERVKETHPDLNDASDASEAFQRVQAAEEVLGDPDERARYDRLGHASYTSHFGATERGGGRRWDVGADRRADADDGGAGRSDGAGRGRGSDGGHDDGEGFGFDPGAYDRTRNASGGAASARGGGRSNASQRSYDVSGGSDDSGGASTDAGPTGAGSTDAGSTDAESTDAGPTGAGATGATAGASGSAAAGATGDAGGDPSTNAGRQGFGDPTDGRHWRERERARSKAAQRDGRSGADTDDRGGYSVHDWNDDDLDTARTPYRLQGSDAVVVGIMFVLYPFVAFSAITPQFSLAVNVTVAACALLMTGYLLTMPRIAIYVFGAWSVIAPLAFLTVPALELVSLIGVIVLAGTWIPFGYSVMFMRVLR
jgi:molecular chaperone DnaJ